MTPNLLSCSETAELLHVSTQRVYQLARIGQLPSIRIGRRVLFESEAVRQYLGGHPVLALALGMHNLLGTLPPEI